MGFLESGWVFVVWNVDVIFIYFSLFEEMKVFYDDVKKWVVDYGWDVLKLWIFLGISLIIVGL